jgi:hypothetical protein
MKKYINKKRDVIFDNLMDEIFKLKLKQRIGFAYRLIFKIGVKNGKRKG